MSKIDNIYAAVDDFGLVTSEEASQLGMSRAELVQQAHMGKLVRVARGVYRMPVWPSQAQAPYAIAVKSAGKDAFLYGESVVALLELAPTNPSKIWLASSKRCRRNLGQGVSVRQISNVDPVLIEGIPCQPIMHAILAAAQTMGVKRAVAAAQEALKKGYITPCEATRIEQELLP
ncbi:hypothetical protein K6V98_00885 [Collinsella sp. AGMB00827]|uniref:AbiEi antitoxin N-terminal domain-containing protein n=1 Tax=Collinsella ureilytica TaxID=2869515 RepID=A0ABS7MHT6_9ACTN|nr:type IV toxin-antitoxin system AbiEi family antitoxin domain-containing protein [Collinsella urealyticum]MBY4796923.1 hypothetical protein [Collinsella urealyticum]